MEFVGLLPRQGSVSQAVNLLEMLARRAQLFRTRTSTERSTLETPERSLPVCKLHSVVLVSAWLFSGFLKFYDMQEY